LPNKTSGLSIDKERRIMIEVKEDDTDNFQNLARPGLAKKELLVE
jgi:hypothetical protein